MSAEIEIYCPSLNIRKTVWIERPVSRLGSDAGCEICVAITELAAHALNVIYENGSYHVVFTSGQTGKINGREIQAGKQVVWPNNDVIECADGVLLQLLIKGDPAPSKAPRIDEEFALEETSGNQIPSDQVPEENSDAGAKNLLSVLVIVACVAGIGLMLFPDLLGSLGVKTKNENIKVPSLKEIWEYDQVSKNLKERIRYASIDTLKSDKTDAKKKFTQIRDLLIASKEYSQFGQPLGETDTEEIKQLRQVFLFVRSRLRALR